MTFKDYKNTPFTPYLLPIIPKNCGPLASFCKIAPENLGKIPGMKSSEGWHGYQGFQKSITTDAMLNNWGSMYGPDQPETIGHRGDDVPALDMDAEDQTAADIVKSVCLMMYGPNAVRGRPNSAKFLMMFRRKAGTPFIHKRKFFFANPMVPEKILTIEIIGRGLHYVIEGAHPSGVLYEWVDGMTPLKFGWDNIPEIDGNGITELFDAIGAALGAAGYDINPPRVAARHGAPGGTGDTTASRTAIGPEHPDQVGDLALLAEFLTECPCDADEFQDRDAWIRALHAIKAACAGDEDFYEAHVWPWCSSYPGNSEDYVRERWESIRDSALGWSYLVSIGQAMGWGGLAKLFGVIDDSVFTGDTAATTRPPATMRPDEAVIAEQFVKDKAKTEWLAVPRGGDTVHWHRTDGGIWLRDDLKILSEASRYCRMASDSIRANPNARSEDLRIARSLQGATVAQHVKTLIRSDERMHVAFAELDARPWLLGFKGGYIDERNRVCAPDPSLFITHSLPFLPDWSMKTPRFDAQISSLTGGSAEESEAIMRFGAYGLSGTGREQAFLFLKGSGGLGITTILELFRMASGTYGGAIPHTAFIVGPAARFAPALLKDLWFAYTSEINHDAAWEEAMLKTATGSGMMPVEEKGIMGFSVWVKWCIIFQGNSVPRFKRIDNGLRRRMMLAPFDGISRTSGEISVEKDLAKIMFAQEGPGILAKLLQARARYQEHGLLFPTRWRTATDEYFNDIDRMAHYLEDRMVYNNTATGIETTDYMFAEWQQWWQDEGMQGHPGSRRAFVNALKAYKPARDKGVRFGKHRIDGSIHQQYCFTGLSRKRAASGAVFGKIDD